MSLPRVGPHGRHRVEGQPHIPAVGTDDAEVRAHDAKGAAMGPTGRRSDGEERSPFGEVHQHPDQLRRVLGDRPQIPLTGAGTGALLGTRVVQ